MYGYKLYCLLGNLVDSLDVPMDSGTLSSTLSGYTDDMKSIGSSSYKLLMTLFIGSMLVFGIVIAIGFMLRPTGTKTADNKTKLKYYVLGLMFAFSFSSILVIIWKVSSSLL